MAYIGSPPASRVLSSADIAQGSVTLDDINFTDQPTNMDISGTIDNHTMRLADGVTVVGDVTLSDNLILSKISDDGNAITLTNDGSTRTIEGEGGSVEASTLTQTPNASLTGMTGEIGSAVTMPSGSIIGMASYSARQTSGNDLSVANGGGDFSATNIDITVKNASSKMIINFTTGENRRDSGADGFTYIKRTVDPSGSPTTTFLDGFADGEGGHLNKMPDTAGGDHGQSFFTIDTHGQAVGTVIRYFIRAYAGTVHDNYYVIVDDVATHHGGYVLEVMT